MSTGGTRVAATEGMMAETGAMALAAAIVPGEAGAGKGIKAEGGPGMTVQNEGPRSLPGTVSANQLGHHLPPAAPGRCMVANFHPSLLSLVTRVATMERKKGSTCTMSRHIHHLLTSNDDCCGLSCLASEVRTLHVIILYTC